MGDYAVLLSGFLDQIPLGDLDLENSAWTPERIRRNEERIRDLGRDDIHVAALAMDGTLCGPPTSGCCRPIRASPRSASRSWRRPTAGTGWGLR